MYFYYITAITKQIVWLFVLYYASNDQNEGEQLHGMDVSTTSIFFLHYSLDILCFVENMSSALNDQAV